MRILVIADRESPWLWDHFEKSKLAGIDLIISCGDLSPHYLSFLATFTDAPVYYIHGNHDEKYGETEPEGCVSIDDRITVFQGIRILGLGGCMNYNGGSHQFTERQMTRRVLRLWFSLLRHKGFDILVTHAPACGLNDGEDLPHRGYQVFVKLLDRYHPKFFLHGHMHLSYRHAQKRVDRYRNTTIINAYERYVFDYEAEEMSPNLYGIPTGAK